MIGVGGMAQEHVRHIEGEPRAVIAAICDPSEQSIAKTRENHAESTANAALFSDYKTMLKEVKLDAVVISSRHSDHFQQIVDSLDAGLHVLCEKPLVNSADDAKKIVAKAKASGKVVGISYQFHMDAAMRFIHKEIASGKYGKVQSFGILHQQDWKNLTVGTWRQDPALSGGGQVHDTGSHLIEVLLWTTGITPESVSARMDNRGTPVDINSVLAVQCANGVLGTLTICGDAKGGYFVITIWCDNGTFYARSGGDFTVQRPDGTTYKPEAEDMPEGTDMIRNFVAAIHGEEEIAVPPSNAVGVMELTEAAWRSAAEGGKPMKVEHS
jgi:predicted dehydrogenase